MAMTDQSLVRIVLASRPEGAPVPENFRAERADIPIPAEGEVLLKVLYLSLDPYMRGRMSEEKSYAAPVEIGGVMVGGTVAEVIDSRRADFSVGDIVLSHSGWQDRKSTRLNSSHLGISYAVFCLKKKK